MEPEASRRGVISELFEQFARNTGLRVIVSGVEKHGSFECAAFRTDVLDRFVVLDVWDEPTFEDGSLNSAEVSIVAEHDFSYVRKISSAFRLSWPPLEQPPDETGSAVPRQLEADLLHRLNDALESAKQLREIDLVNRKIDPISSDATA